MKHTSLIFLWQPKNPCIAVPYLLHCSSKILHCSFQCFFLAVSNKSLIFVKILPTKNGNFDLAVRKRLFCDAKQPLLPCKTYAFAMQNNRFCKVLVHRWLCDCYGCEKCLQFRGVFRLYIIRYRGERVGVRKSDFCLEGLSCGSDVLLVFHCLCILMAKFGLSPL